MTAVNEVPVDPGVASRGRGGNVGHGGRRVAVRALVLGVGCGCVYTLVAGNLSCDFRQTPFAHHVLIADAMLNGQLHLREEILGPLIEQGRREAEENLAAHERETGRVVPPDRAEARIRDWIRYRTLHDWTPHRDRIYGYWAPLTPVVTMPFVAIFGHQVSDQLISALFGGLNVGLFYCLLGRLAGAGLLRARESCRVGLTLLFAFGTVNFYMSCTGRVWFAAQVVTLTAMLLALITACGPGHRRREWLTGALFGAAFLGRNVVAFLGLFFVVLAWQRSGPRGPRRTQRFAGSTFAFLAPVVAAVGVQGLYNHARFDDVFDSGQSALLRTHGDPGLLRDYERYGHFSLHFLPRNLKHYFWNAALPRVGDGEIGFDPNGNSMFLVTPPLLYVFLAGRRRRRRAVTLAAAAGALPTLGALLTFRATGYFQFGNRYLLEMMPLLLLLVAGGMRGRITHVGFALIVLAVAANLYGTWCFARPQFEIIRPWVTPWILPVLVILAATVRVVAVLRRGRVLDRARGRPAPAPRNERNA